MILTNSNYFSKENNIKYMSASQFKSFFLECEAKALAEAKGDYVREKTKPMLVGSFVDAYFEGSLDDFKLENPEIFKKDGGLKSDFRQAEDIIARVQRDEFFMQFLSGQKQVIKTGEIEGVLFKSKIDSYHEGRAIVDLKVMKDFSREWKDGLKISFIEKWGYDLQASIYVQLEGNNLPFFIAAVTKEKEPDLEIISIPRERLDVCLDMVKKHVKRFDDIKKGLVEPTRCEKCNWCKSTKKLTEIISYEDIGE